MPSQTLPSRTERRILPGAVYRLRKAYKLTQDELATSADINFSYFSRVENGKRSPSLDVIARIARALGVDIDDISYLTTVYEIPSDAA